MLTSAEWDQTGLPLIHVSITPHAIGALVNASYCNSRPQVAFFITPPLPEHDAVPDYRARRRVEQCFEALRTSAYPALPSRRDVLFCSPREADARAWWSKPARKGRPVFRVKLSAQSTVVVLDLLWYNYAVRIANDESINKRFVLGGANDDDEITLAAHGYWSGDLFTAHGGDPCIEALVRGQVTVAEQLKF